MPDCYHRASGIWCDGYSDSGRRAGNAASTAFEIGQMVGRQLPFTTIIVLFDHGDYGRLAVMLKPGLVVVGGGRVVGISLNTSALLYWGRNC